MSTRKHGMVKRLLQLPDIKIDLPVRGVGNTALFPAALGDDIEVSNFWVLGALL